MPLLRMLQISGDHAFHAEPQTSHTNPIRTLRHSDAGRGWGEFGRLGHGDTTSHREPSPLTHDSLQGAVMISCGGHHTVAVTEDGHTVSWGWGSDGQLGISRPPAPSRVCVRVHAYIHAEIHTTACMHETHK